jgi:heme a synthase
MKKSRSIFEEVDATPAEPAPAPARASRPASARGAIRVWLAILFAMLVVMIAVGGLTRLTDSGLSITEWRPVAGAMPPSGEAAWTAEFDKYRASPQYAALNHGMTLGEFKRIYWWEWSHRQLGRAIGAVWALGFLWFAVRRQIPPGWTPRLIGLGVLGGLQGAIGWWMVASGLEAGMIAVASYRLAIHLGLAFAILGLIAWYVLRLGRPEAELLQARRQRSVALMRWGTVLVAVTFLQIVLGALVAGIDAGRAYTDWPLMGGEVVPSGALALSPGWTNFLENPALVQFNHRLVAYLLLAIGFLAFLRSRRSALGHIRGAFAAMLAMLVLQLVLGIVTVLHGAPLPIAILHQLGAVALFVLVVRARFAALYPLAERIARGKAPAR